MGAINLLIPRYRMAGNFFLLVVFFEIYKLIFNPEWDSRYVMIVALLGYILHHVYELKIDSLFKAFSSPDPMKYRSLRASSITFGMLYFWMLYPLLFYCFFYKGIYGIIKLFGNFSFLELGFRLVIMAVSAQVVSSMQNFSPHAIARAIDEDSQKP